MCESPSEELAAFKNYSYILTQLTAHLQTPLCKGKLNETAYSHLEKLNASQLAKGEQLNWFHNLLFMLICTSSISDTLVNLVTELPDEDVIVFTDIIDTYFSVTESEFEPRMPRESALGAVELRCSMIGIPVDIAKLALNQANKVNRQMKGFHSEKEQLTSMLNIIEEQNRTLEGQLSEQTSRVLSLESENQMLNKEIKILKESDLSARENTALIEGNMEVNKMSTLLYEKNLELAALKAESDKMYVKYLEETDELKRLLAQNKEENSSKHEIVRALKEENMLLKQDKAKNKTSAKEIEDSNRLIDQQKSEILSLQRQKQHIYSECLKLEESQKQLKSEIVNYKYSNSSLEKDVSALRAEIKDYIGKIEEMRREAGRFSMLGSGNVLVQEEDSRKRSFVPVDSEEGKVKILEDELVDAYRELEKLRDRVALWSKNKIVGNHFSLEAEDKKLSVDSNIVQISLPARKKRNFVVLEEQLSLKGIPRKRLTQDVSVINVLELENEDLKKKLDLLEKRYKVEKESNSAVIDKTVANERETAFLVSENKDLKERLDQMKRELEQENLKLTETRRELSRQANESKVEEEERLDLVKRAEEARQTRREFEEKVATLNAEIEVLKVSNAKFKQELEIVNSAGFEAKIAFLEREKEELLKQNSRFREELPRVSADLKEKSVNLDLLESKLEAETKISADSLAKLKEVEIELQLYRDREAKQDSGLNEIILKMKEAQIEASKTREELKETAENLSKARNKSTELEDQLEEKDRETRKKGEIINKLTKENDLLNSTLDSTKQIAATLVPLRQELSATKKLLTEAQNSLVKARKYQNDLVEKASAHKIQLEQTKHSLERKVGDAGSLESQLEQTKRELRETVALLEQATQSKEEQAEELKETRKQLIACKSSLSKEEEAKLAEEKENCRVKAELKALMEEKSALEKEAKRRNETAEELKAQLEAKRVQLDNLQNVEVELSRSKQDLLSAAEREEDLKRELKVVSQENKSKLEGIDNKEREILKMSQEISILKAERDSLTSKNSVIESERTKLEETVRLLTNSKNELEITVQRQKRELNRAVESEEAASKRLEECLWQLKERELGENKLKISLESANQSLVRVSEECERLKIECSQLERNREEREKEHEERIKLLREENSAEQRANAEKERLNRELQIEKERVAALSSGREDQIARLNDSLSKEVNSLKGELEEKNKEIRTNLHKISQIEADLSSKSTKIVLLEKENSLLKAEIASKVADTAQFGFELDKEKVTRELNNKETTQLVQNLAQKSEKIKMLEIESASDKRVLSQIREELEQSTRDNSQMSVEIEQLSAKLESILGQFSNLRAQKAENEQERDKIIEDKAKRATNLQETVRANIENISNLKAELTRVNVELTRRRQSSVEKTAKLGELATQIDQKRKMHLDFELESTGFSLISTRFGPILSIRTAETVELVAEKRFSLFFGRGTTFEIQGSSKTFTRLTVSNTGFSLSPPKKRVKRVVCNYQQLTLKSAKKNLDFSREAELLRQIERLEGTNAAVKEESRAMLQEYTGLQQEIDELREHYKAEAQKEQVAATLRSKNKLLSEDAKQLAEEVKRLVCVVDEEKRKRRREKNEVDKRLKADKKQREQENKEIRTKMNRIAMNLIKLKGEFKQLKQKRQAPKLKEQVEEYEENSDY